MRPRPQRVGSPGPKQAAPFAHPVRPHAECPPDRRAILPVQRPQDRPRPIGLAAIGRSRQGRQQGAYLVRHHQPGASRHVRPSLQLPCLSYRHVAQIRKACLAGLTAIQAIGRLRTPDGETLAARVGIATGVVIIGDLIGEGAAQEEAVVGETPNLAARLQALAQPDAVLIGPATRRLIGGAFELEDLGPQVLKGFTDPVPAWRVTGTRSVESRFEARTTGLSLLVGREQEVALLLDRWEQVKDGEGHAVLLSGEPGIGKSRIVRAICEYAEPEAHLRLRYQCSPHYTSTAFHPVIEQLERAAGLARDDPDPAKLEKLDALLAQGIERVSEAAPLIATLLSIPTDGRYPPLAHSPQRQRELTIEALVEQLLGLARRKPVLCIFEDLHWADPSTLDVLGPVIDRIGSARVLLLLTCRPEFASPWTSRSHVTLHSLKRLGRRQSATLVEGVTGGKALPTRFSNRSSPRRTGCRCSWRS